MTDRDSIAAVGRRRVLQAIASAELALAADELRTAHKSDHVVTADAEGRSTSVNADWRMHCLDVTNNQYVPNRTGPQEQVTLRWKFETDSNNPQLPVVWNGTAYFGDSGPYIYAVDLATGDLEWKTDLDIGIKNSPAIYKNEVYVTTADGRIYRLDPNDGSQTFIGSINDRDIDINTSPTITNDTLIVHNSGSIHAFDLSEEHNLWTKAVANRSRHVGHAIGNGSVVFVDNNGMLHSVALSDGTDEWTKSIPYEGGEFMESPVVSGDRVYCGSARPTMRVVPVRSPRDTPDKSAIGIHAFDLSTGTRDWQQITENVSSIKNIYPIIGQEYVYFGTARYRLDGTEVTEYQGLNSNDTGHVPFDGVHMYDISAFDREVFQKKPGEDKLKVVNMFELNDLESQPQRGLVLLEEAFLIRTGAGSVALFEADTAGEGDKTSTLTAQNAVAVNDGTAYLILSGEVLKVELATRSVVNRFQAPSGTDQGLAYGAGSLWYSDAATDAYDGQILELDPGTGDVRSEINTGSLDGLAFGDGSLWAVNPPGPTELGTGDIIEFTPDGEQIGRISFDYTRGPGFAYANGSFWVGTRSELLELSPDGSVVQSISEHDAGYKGLAGTEAVLYGPDSDGMLSVIRRFDTSASFDPATHGFGFDNYDTPSVPSFENLLEVVNDSYSSTLKEIDIIDRFTNIVVAAVVYTAFEGGLTNGHCLGMVFTAREYYNQGVPALPEYDSPVETASDITLPDGETPDSVSTIESVAQQINQRQQTQAFDSTYALRYLATNFALSPSSEPGAVNHSAVLKAIKRAIEDGRTAPISLARSLTSGHQVLAYDITPQDEQFEQVETINEARTVEVAVYDPNKKAGQYPGNENLLRFTREADNSFKMSGYETRGITYDRAMYVESVNPDYEFFTGSDSVDGFRKALSDGLANYLAVGVQSPVSLSIEGPAGESLRELDVSEAALRSATEYEKLYFGTEISSGDYTIEATGTGEGEYTITVKGKTTDGGDIDDSYTSEINAGESQSLRATLPEAPGETGNVGSNDSSPPSGPEQRVLQITGRSSPQELTQDDVSNMITLFNRNETVNGIRVTQDDVSNTITLFERN